MLAKVLSLNYILLTLADYVSENSTLRLLTSFFIENGANISEEERWWSFSPHSSSPLSLSVVCVSISDQIYDCFSELRALSAAFLHRYFWSSARG